MKSLARARVWAAVKAIIYVDKASISSCRGRMLSVYFDDDAYWATARIMRNSEAVSSYFISVLKLNFIFVILNNQIPLFILIV